MNLTLSNLEQIKDYQARIAIEDMAVQIQQWASGTASSSQLDVFANSTLAAAVAAAGVPSYLYANLPVPSLRLKAGTLARVIDRSRGLWMFDGVQWVSLNGQVYDAAYFGFVGDGVTDNYPAWLRLKMAIDSLDPLLYRGSRITIPYGKYYFSQALQLSRHQIIQGAGGKVTGGVSYLGFENAGTVLLFPPGVTGISVTAVSHGSWSTIRDLELRGIAKSGTCYGIDMKQRTFVENVHITGFGSHGINITASIASSENANDWRVNHARIEECGGDGLHVSGTDANAGNASNVDSVANDGYGFYDKSTYGNTYTNCSTESNVTGCVKHDDASFTNRCQYIGGYHEGAQAAAIMGMSAVVIGGSWQDGFTAGSQCTRFADDKLILGASANPRWSQASAISRGIYANQGSAINDEIFALAASGRVAHAMSTYTDPATWLYIEQATASGGGATITGLSEETLAMRLRAFATGEVTAEGASDNAPLVLDVAKSNGGTAIAVLGATANGVAFRNGGSNVSFVKADGTYAVRGTYGVRVAPDHLLVGTTSVTGSTLGVRVDVGASAFDEAYSARATGRVAHGITNYTNTATWMFMEMAGTGGGVQFNGFTSDTVGMDLRGYATTTDTTESTTSHSAVEINPSLKDGVAVKLFADDDNLVTIRNAGTTRFIFKGDGSSWQDVGTAWTNYDAFEDADLLTALSVAASPVGDPVKAQFMDTLLTHRDTLERCRLITINDGPDEDGSVFVNLSGIQMLLVGAVRQQADALKRLGAHVAALTRTIQGLVTADGL